MVVLGINIPSTIVQSYNDGLLFYHPVPRQAPNGITSTLCIHITDTCLTSIKGRELYESMWPEQG